MKRTVLLITLLVASALRCFGVIPIDAEEFRKSIVFIYPPTISGSVDTTRFATGFVVGIPLKDDPAGAYTVLITARHVIDPDWIGCAYQGNPDRVFVRVNRKGYDPKGTESGTTFLPIALQKNGQRLWVHHEDETVDVAVIPIVPETRLALDGKDWNLYDYDVLAIPFRAFPTDDELVQLKIATSVFTAGLVPELANAKRNYPTFKFGRISNIFDEPIQIPCNVLLRPPKAMSIWSIAANFVGGNSGSPVFLFPIDVVQSNGIMLSGARPLSRGWCQRLSLEPTSQE